MPDDAQLSSHGDQAPTSAERLRAILDGLLRAFADVPLNELEDTVAETLTALRRASEEDERDQELPYPGSGGAPALLDEPPALARRSAEQFPLGLPGSQTARRQLQEQFDQLWAELAHLDEQAKQAQQFKRDDLLQII